MSDDFSFEKLIIYKRSLQFSIELCRKASNFPFKFSRLRDQLIGAAISVPLNITEGSGRTTYKDRIRFYKIAQASAYECIPILDICFQLSLISDSFHKTFKQELTEISKMISAFIKSIH